MVVQGDDVAMPTEGDVLIETPSFHDDFDHLYCGNVLYYMSNIIIQLKL